MVALRNYMMALEQGQRIAAADAERAKVLQGDATFWEPGEVPDADDPIPLWKAICIFKGMNPAHWALTNPAYAERMHRHTTGDVAERLKELLRLHGKALGHIETGKLQACPDVSSGFRTTLEWVTVWAVPVGKAPPAQCPAPDAQSTPKGLNAPKVHTTNDTRRDILTPVIEHAQSLCKDQWDVAEVWGQFHKLAGVQYLVLLHVEGNSIAYTDGDETKFLKRKVLAERIRRQKNKAAL